MPAQPLYSDEPEDGLESESLAIQDSSLADGVIDDFEGDPPSGTYGWEPAWDASTETTISCELVSTHAYEGSQSLEMVLDVAPESWATCGLFFDTLRNWSDDGGLAFYMRASQPDVMLELNLYVEDSEQQESYIYRLPTSSESTAAWVPLAVHWDDFHRVEWEENAGETFKKTERIHGLAFGFSATEGVPNSGTLWIDDLRLFHDDTSEMIEPSEAEAPEADSPRRILPCGSVLTPLLATVWIWGLRRRKR
jgi:hypothetical protein